MEQILSTAGAVGLPVAIAAVVGAIIAILISYNIKQSRETVRTLRIALESDPSPGQINQARELFPDATQFPQSQQVGHMVRLANKMEGKRAESAEKAMTICRLLFALAFVGGAVYVASIFFKPGGG